MNVARSDLANSFPVKRDKTQDATSVFPVNLDILENCYWYTKGNYLLLIWSKGIGTWWRHNKGEINLVYKLQVETISQNKGP